MTAANDLSDCFSFVSHELPQCMHTMTENSLVGGAASCCR
jgi:hypothetical protein